MSSARPSAHRALRASSASTTIPFDRPQFVPNFRRRPAPVMPDSAEPTPVSRVLVQAPGFPPRCRPLRGADETGSGARTRAPESGAPRSDRLKTSSSGSKPGLSVAATRQGGDLARAGPGKEAAASLPTRNSNYPHGFVHCVPFSVVLFADRRTVLRQPIPPYADHSSPRPRGV